MQNVLVVRIASQGITHKINGLTTACSFICSKHCIVPVFEVGQTGLVFSQKKADGTDCLLLLLPLLQNQCQNYLWDFENPNISGCWYYWNHS
jgi:hypothetical protein